MTWTGFIVVFVSTKLRLVDLGTEEALWGAVDFLGKVMFSSSLLQSNFLTMDERRAQAAKRVEEGRQKQVRDLCYPSALPNTPCGPHPPPMPHAMLLLPLAHAAAGAGGADVPRAPGERTVAKSGGGWERLP